MSHYQPLHDTINLMAGGAVRRTARPGEQFERPQPRPVTRRQRSQMRQLLLSLLFKLQAQ